MKKRELGGAVVVLTGASSGIGRASARLFAQRGARLVLAARDGGALDETARECREMFGAQALAAPVDVRDEASVDAIAELAVHTFGKIDVWVNDAAHYMMGPLEAYPTKAIRELFDTNVMGVVHGMRTALAVFRRQRTGVLVNVGSMAGKIAYAEAGAYCASKHAVHALTEAARQELRGSDVHACLVVPGTVDTPFFQHAANYTGREILAMRPIYRAERVAQAIVSCAERPRREVMVGAAPRLMVLFDRLAPRLFERVARALVIRDHLGRGGVPAHPGNLAEPRPPHAASGEWRRRRSFGPRAAAQARTLALPILTSGG